MARRVSLLPSRSYKSIHVVVRLGKLETFATFVLIEARRVSRLNTRMFREAVKLAPFRRQIMVGVKKVP